MSEMNVQVETYSAASINYLLETSNTVVVSIMKPTFSIGQDVEVYYNRTGRYHRCRVSSFSLKMWGHAASDNKLWVGANWHYYCEVLDDTIKAKNLVGIQYFSGEDSIREVTE